VVAGLAAILLAGFLLWRTLGRYDVGEVLAAIRAIPPHHMALALVFSAASYLCLTGFDALGLRYAGVKLPYAKVALASFVSLSIGHNVGLGAAGAGALRYRFYSRWGVSAEGVAKVVLFSGSAVVLGLATLGAAAMLSDSSLIRSITGPSDMPGTAIGLVLLCVPVLYLAASALVVGEVRIRKWTFGFPPLRLAAVQCLLGTVNFAMVAASLFQVIAAVKEAGYFDVAAAYVASNFLTLVSHAPGGVGVIETVVVNFLPGAAVVGAVLVFRAAYFLLPLAIGLLTLAVTELVFRAHAAGKRP
jgi:uncharacterized membrane protein YbhN (UPF0104 family)